MSVGLKRFFIGALGCDSFAAKRRVLRELVREKLWREQIENGYVPVRSRRILLNGREYAAFFMIVQVERSPLVYLAGIPVAIGLYLAMLLSYLF